MLTRYRMMGFWPFRRAVLEVADSGTHHVGNGVYQLHKPWRRAKHKDVIALELEQSREREANRHPRLLPPGTRVKSNGFNRGAIGTVVFQEPAGGKVWVLRDGADGPCYFWNPELDLL